MRLPLGGKHSGFILRHNDHQWEELKGTQAIRARTLLGAAGDERANDNFSVTFSKSLSLSFIITEMHSTTDGLLFAANSSRYKRYGTEQEGVQADGTANANI